MEKYIIVLPDGSELSSGIDTVNAIATVRHTASVNSGVDLTLGSVCAAMVEATIITPKNDFSIAAGEEITLYTEAEDGTRTKHGIFAVEKPTRSGANRTKLTAYDRVARLDKDISKWLGELKEYPYTLGTMVEMVCAECGVTLKAEQTIPNADFQIPKKPTEHTTTGRQLMQWMAEIAGRFVTANADGELVFDWYKLTGTVITPGGSNYYFSGSLSYENFDVAAVDAVKFRVFDGESSAFVPAGDAENPYIVTGNKLLTLFGSAAPIETALVPMLTSAAISYTPCKFSVPVTSGVKVGQIVRVRDINGKEIKTLVMSTKRAGQKITVTSTGNATRSTSESFYEEQNYKDYADEAVKGQTQQDIFNKLTNDGEEQGLYIKDGRIYLNATFMQTGILSADLIRAGRIRSTDFELGYSNVYYPAEDLYPSAALYPSNGEEIVKGFEIDFESGKIRGAFWSEPINRLKEKVEDIDTRLKAIEALL